MALAKNHNLTAEEVNAALEALQAAPEGLTNFDLQRAVYGSVAPMGTMDLRILMANLRQEKKVATKGQLRGMKYQWVG
jgi:hypothetical protein